MTKKQKRDLDHATLTAAAIGQPLSEPDCIGGREWEISTLYGVARVSVHSEDSSIYWRFAEPEGGWRKALAPSFHHNGGNLNRHSGKWNLHASGEDFTAESQYNAAHLKSRMRNLVPL